MLKLVHINKDYPLKDQPTVHALKDVSINFRRNEFVAILGPSGCGKTTLLNITGGLDRYTNGDLIIEGRSTKKYTDHDWDTYRNHSIGFVFQTYNLVSHLTVLGNVELALTIGGIKRNERKQRAMKVIDQVGLQGLYKKMPNQLSGGQMQRVAIARALVNNPEIVLADEPTGALDSETSLQIMDLLKEVAKDRLVIMVTHNPDLANRYANRIINLKDGEVIQDSKPYSDVEEELSVRPIREKNASRKHVAQSKMSIPTSFGLSARNLLAKFKRTALVCIAGSIGIIGVSAVLAVSTGVKSYIKDMQDDMLSGNPIAVEKSSLDLTSLMASFSKTAQQNAVTQSYEDGYIDVDSMIAYLTAQKDNLESYMVNNDINQDYIDFVDEMPKEYYATMEKEYGINFKLNMYTDVNLTDATGSSVGEDKTLSLAELESMYIKIVKSTSYGEYASVFSLLTDVFFSCPDSEDYILSQYDLLAGNVATADDEMMLVVSSDREVTDVFLGQLGYYTQDEFVALVNKYAYGEDNPFDDGTIVRDRFTEEEMMNKEFVYVPYTSGYSFIPNPTNTEANIQNNFVNSGSVMDVPYIYNGEATSLDDLTNNAALGAKKIKISGILCAKDNVNYGCLDTGFVVSPALEQMILTDAADAGINTTLQNSYDNIYSNVPDSIGGTALTDTQKAAWQSTYTMAVPYSYSYNYKHYNEDTDQVEVINSGMGENYTSALSVINMEGMSSSTSGAMSDVFSKLFSGSYSIENQFDTAIRAVGGKTLAAGVKIYPYNFNKKYLVTDYLDQWNGDGNITINAGTPEEKIITPSEREDITYSDSLEMIITLINTMIDIVTIALVCFTSLSLIVSTVMIGIITYVSVLERVKEIGVIRSLGGRKNDVSNLFNAETFIEGFSSGLFGVFITYILCIIINIVVNNFANLGALVILPWNYAIIIIIVSILLTLISGLIPSRVAAHKDPVIALRTE